MHATGWGELWCFTRGSTLSRSNAEDGRRLEQCSMLATPPSFTVLLWGDLLSSRSMAPEVTGHPRTDSTQASADTLCFGPPWLESLKDETENELILFPQLKICNKVSGEETKSGQIHVQQPPPCAEAVPPCKTL